MNAPFLISNLTTRIAEGWPADGRLPTVRALARQLGTSAVTMVKVLKTLREQGFVEKRPGRSGYYVPERGAPASAAVLDDSPRGRGEAIAAVIRDEILQGQYPASEPMPQQKHLCARFGCSHGTVRKALALLVGERLLQREGTRYRLREFRGRARSVGVYVCGYPQVVDHTADDVYDLVHAAESAVQRFGWGQLQFFLAGTNTEHVRMIPELPDLAPSDHQVAGYVFIRYRYRGGWKRFLLSRKRIPLVVVDFDQMADFDDNPDPIANDRNFARLHRNCTIVVPDNRIAGQEVAGHLAVLGHRRAAFFSHVSLDDPRKTRRAWARLRYDGVASVFRPGGDGERRLCVYDGSGQMRVQEHTPASDIWSKLGRVPAAVHEEGHDSLQRVREVAEISRVMTPLFQQALADRDITAWVCCTDQLAAVARDFLKAHGMAVPGRIALVGFGNTRLSYRADISSYDFGYERIGNLAVSYLVYPRLRPRSDSPITHVSGQLVTRASTVASG